MSDSDPQWYVRRGSAIQGPFSQDRIHHYLLLGRVRLTDRVSLDGESWIRITQRPDLVPEAMRDLGTEEGLARYEAARRAVDEREREEDEQLLVGGERAVDPIPTVRKPRHWVSHQLVTNILLVAVAVLLTLVVFQLI